MYPKTLFSHIKAAVNPELNVPLNSQIEGSRFEGAQAFEIADFRASVGFGELLCLGHSEAWG